MNESGEVPIVVDLDGTLTPTDTLAESVVAAVKRTPATLLYLPFWLAKGRAGFKEIIAARGRIPTEHLPYRGPLLEYLQEQKANGRPIVLATAAHQSIAEGVARHLGIFDQVLATTATKNLKGTAKLEAIHEQVGPAFVYAGDSESDIPIWKAAQAAVLVGVSPAISRAVRNDVPVEREFRNDREGLSTWLQAMRVHQWLKNLLLFVPLLTAFSFTDPGKFIDLAMAFVAFSLAASATYMVNDLWDLENDRSHPRKRLRPFASARLSIMGGFAAATLMMVVATALALVVSRQFFLVLAIYVMLTSAYSWALKEYVIIDVLMLSILYTLRIVAGAVAAGISASSWLLAFSVFMFLSLALVKRCAELVSLEGIGRGATRGRDYRVTDLMVLWPLGIGSALSAIVVFGLFINAPETRTRYENPQMLWLIALALIYWLARLWVKTSRGEMHDDPVVYAVRDHASRSLVFGAIAVMLAAHFLRFQSSI